MTRCFLIFFLLIFSALGKELKLDSPITPFLNQYCFECHGGKKVKGKVDFNNIKSAKDLQKNYKLFENMLDLVQYGDMPPEDELQPTEHDKKIFLDWYSDTFEKNIVAKAGPAKARKLSVSELNNTLTDLLGFPLEISVAKAEETVSESSLIKKMLPLDPPGRSGYTNDTHDNPLTNAYWERLSYIFDFAIEELFTPEKQTYLEKYSGPIEAQGWSWKNTELFIKNFLPKVYRRSLPPRETNHLLTSIKQDGDYLENTKFEIKVALMSPSFLYRGFNMSKLPSGQHPVDNFELAERMSYFLWGSMPDRALLNEAAKGTLHHTANLKTQMLRMLNDKRSRNLSDHFAKQWLNLSEIKHASGRYPYIQSLMQQPLDFIHYLILEDRPLLELIDSNVTFANPLLAKIYNKDRKQINPSTKKQGIEMVFDPLNKIDLINTKHRGGLLTMPGVLAMNAAKNRTSPVLRGTWMLEKILGDHLGEPPADVDPIPPNKKGEELTFRERFERHRSDAACSTCHNRIDPLGFAMESYDANGMYRQKLELNKKKVDIDASGEYKGSSFNNFVELKHLLLTKHKESIVKNLVQQFMSYALCRKLELNDKPIVDAIAKDMHENNGSYHDLIFAIINSMSFKEVTITSEEI